MPNSTNQVDLNLVWQLIERQTTAMNNLPLTSTASPASAKEQQSSNSSSSTQQLLRSALNADKSATSDNQAKPQASLSAAAQEKLLRAWLTRSSIQHSDQSNAPTIDPLAQHHQHHHSHSALQSTPINYSNAARPRPSLCTQCNKHSPPKRSMGVPPVTSVSAAAQWSHMLRKAGKGSLKRLRDHHKRLRQQILLATQQAAANTVDGTVSQPHHGNLAKPLSLHCPQCTTNSNMNSNHKHLLATANVNLNANRFCAECSAAQSANNQFNSKAFWNEAMGVAPAHPMFDIHLPIYSSASSKAEQALDPHRPSQPPPLSWDVEQWRRKLRKQRLKRKERNILMVVLSVAILLFVGISYFGAILFIRTTRMHDAQWSRFSVCRTRLWMQNSSHDARVSPN